MKKTQRFVVAVAIGLGLCAMWSCQPGSAGVGAYLDEEDRPPIIVSNGSVKIEAQIKHKKNGKVDPLGPGRGSFEAVNSADYTKGYRHLHGNKNTKSLGIIVLGATEASCGNIPEEVEVYSGVPIKITYGDGTNTFNVSFKIDGNYLAFFPPETPDVSGSYVAYLKKTDGNVRITSAAFSTDSSTPITCDFALGSSPLIEIFQHKH